MAPKLGLACTRWTRRTLWSGSSSTIWGGPWTGSWMEPKTSDWSPLGFPSALPYLWPRWAWRCPGQKHFVNVNDWLWSMDLLLEGSFGLPEKMPRKDCNPDRPEFAGKRHYGGFLVAKCRRTVRLIQFWHWLGTWNIRINQKTCENHHLHLRVTESRMVEIVANAGGNQNAQFRTR